MSAYQDDDCVRRNVHMNVAADRRLGVVAKKKNMHPSEIIRQAIAGLVPELLEAEDNMSIARLVQTKQDERRTRNIGVVRSVYIPSHFDANLRQIAHELHCTRSDLINVAMDRFLAPGAAEAACPS